MPTSERPYAVTVFGATGFTGRLTAEYLARTIGATQRWAIAGRSASKLEEVKRALVAIDPACEAVGVVEAAVDDPSSLAAMTREAVTLITTVGPYARHGMPVAEACIEGGANYVDITGEPQFVHEMIERCDARARDKGLRLVNTCGFDSVPHDLGVLYTVKLLPRGEALTVEGFVRASGTFSGGTWQSAIEGFSKLRKNAASMRTPTATEGRRVRGMRPSLRYDAELGAWVCPLPTIDPQVVLRSAAVLDEYGPDFRYAHYAQIRSTLVMAGGALGLAAVVGLAQIPPAKRWLLSLKQSGEGPDEARRARAKFSVTLRGRSGARTVVTRVSGGDPGYAETSKMVAESALCLSLDAAQLPERYGVLTPAVAMGERLTERLQRAGIRFEVLRG